MNTMAAEVYSNLVEGTNQNNPSFPLYHDAVVDRLIEASNLGAGRFSNSTEMIRFCRTHLPHRRRDQFRRACRWSRLNHCDTFRVNQLCATHYSTERINAVVDALQTLPETERNLILKAVVEGKTDQQIAEENFPSEARLSDAPRQRVRRERLRLLEKLKEQVSRLEL